MTTTPEMVERVAWKIWAAMDVLPMPLDPVDGVLEFCHAEIFARAAIEAMLRKPTDAMVWASCNYFKKLAACLHTGKEPKPCQRCPGSVETDYGPGQQACRGFAEEYIEHVLDAALEGEDATTAAKETI